MFKGAERDFVGYSITAQYVHLKLIRDLAFFKHQIGIGTLFNRGFVDGLGRGFASMNGFLHQTQFFNVIHQSHPQGFALAGAQPSR